MIFWDWFCAVCGTCVLCSVALYVIPLLVLTFSTPQNLRKKYGEWALVTGASSGIGLAIARKLASQSINVCIAALDDEYLATSVTALQESYPAVRFRAVGVDLASDPDAYMKRIREATKDLPISIFVNNAGYLVMGYFDELDVDVHMRNLECNALAGIRLVHHIYSRMISEKRRGCIALISSSAWFIPSPYATIYGASKAMLSSFATSLSIEARNHDVDICVIHPSYTHTNLYRNTPKLDFLSALAKFGWSPDDVADVFTNSVGRVVVRDAGLYTVLTNIFGRLIDAGTVARLITPFRSMMGPPPKRT